MLTKQQILQEEKTSGARNLNLRREFNNQILKAGGKRKNKSTSKPRKKRKPNEWALFVKKVCANGRKYGLEPTKNGKYSIIHNERNLRKVKEMYRNRRGTEVPDHFDDPNEYQSNDAQELEKLANDLDDLDFYMELERRTKGLGQQGKDRVKAYMLKKKKEIKKKLREEREREQARWQNRDNNEFNERRAREFERQKHVKRG